MAPTSGASTIAARTPAPTFFPTASGSCGPRPATVSTCPRATTPIPSTIRRAPCPAPDGRHFVFVKVLPPRNYEIYLGDLQSDAQIRLTYSDAFDGFPAISPDGRWLLFASSRDSKPDERLLTLYLMDISSLNLDRPGSR